MNGRVYDYNLGRFLSVDPFIQAPGNSQSMNPYSYIMNNPLAGVDPSGYTSTCNGSPCEKSSQQTSSGNTTGATAITNGNKSTIAIVNVYRDNSANVCNDCHGETQKTGNIIAINYSNGDVDRFCFECSAGNETSGPVTGGTSGGSGGYLTLSAPLTPQEQAEENAVVNGLNAAYKKESDAREAHIKQLEAQLADLEALQASDNPLSSINTGVAVGGVGAGIVDISNINILKKKGNVFLHQNPTLNAPRIGIAKNVDEILINVKGFGKAASKILGFAGIAVSSLEAITDFRNPSLSQSQKIGSGLKSLTDVGVILASSAIGGPVGLGIAVTYLAFDYVFTIKNIFQDTVKYYRREEEYQ